ncbi:hypothetical protein GW915_04975 [bacterium]|nr:hypothetical protein [bacterium]
MGRYICPVCRAHREVDLRDRISWNSHSKILITIAFLSITAYLLRGPALAFKLTFLYLPIWAMIEFFHWSKVRNDSKCPHCFFDPILYQRDWKAARKIVEERLGSIKSVVEKERAIKVAQFLGKAPPTEEQGPAPELIPENPA